MTNAALARGFVAGPVNFRRAPLAVQHLPHDDDHRSPLQLLQPVLNSAPGPSPACSENPLLVACLGCSVTAMLAALPSSQRRTLRRRQQLGVCGLRASEEGGAEPPRPRRRRRRKVPQGDVAVQESVDLCDCDLILDTVLEVEGMLTPNQCDELIFAAQKRARKMGWKEDAHEYAKTDDVKIWNLESPKALTAFRNHLVKPMKDLIAEHFKLPERLIEVQDGFVVRYKEGKQTALDYHRDGSVISAIVTLSEADEYEGGGTMFRDGSTYRPEQGSAIIFPGQLEHCGLKITSGTRFICTMFFKVGCLSCRDEAVARDRGYPKLAEQVSSNNNGEGHEDGGLLGQLSSMFGG
mmetsp:Transcript_46455/g.92229  ORF Transcript_46455/g.92229 Transcript_46455/m.92229 type:complete len:351 (-) Transcript_46455:62-1114(-)